MKQGAILSAVLHGVAILVAYFGLPHLLNDAPEMNQPVPVDIVNLGEETKAPPAPAPKPEPEAKPKPPPEPEPPPPPPPLEVKQPPPPPEPEPAPAPEPVPEPKLAKVEPAPPPEPEPQPQPQPVEAPRPRLKPKPPSPPPKPRQDFASVLKSLETPKERAPAEEKEEKKEEETLERQLESLVKPRRRARLSDPSRELTISEKDAIRRQIERCWNVPAGARDAEDLVVDIWVAVNPDGTIRQAKIVDAARMQSDSFFRAAAESALRAVLNPRCSPLKLPPEKYNQWKTMTLTFNPREILGG